jgi:hypothetical protein
MTHGHCQLESGFFVLRVCGKQAVGKCSVCSNAYCQQHSGDAFETGLCITCARERGATHDQHDDHHSADHPYSREHSRPWNLRNRRDRDDDFDERNTQTAAAAAAFTAAEAAEFEQAGQESISDTDGDQASDFDLEADAGDISIFDS